MVRKKTSPKESGGQSAEGVGETHGCEAGEKEAGARHGVVGVDFYVADYLRDRGYKCTLRDNSVTVDCPACAQKRCLGVSNDLGTWSCEKCGRNGGFDGLRRLFGDVSSLSVQSPVSGQADMLVPDFVAVKYHRDYQKQLGQSGSGKREWLTKMGVPDAMIAEYRIGYNVEFDALTFPYLYRRSLGSTSYLRMFREPDDWWKAVGDPVKASWFGQHRFKTGIKRAVITQTPLDALCLASIGVENVLAGIVDTPRVRLRSHALALLQRCDEVLVCPNPTDEGADWARAMREQIGDWRCRVMQLDCYARDIRELSRFDERARLAVDSVGIRVGPVVDWFEEVDREFEGGEAVKGYPTKLEPLDKLLGGWRRGELTVLAGEPGSGKSTLAGYLSLLQAGSGRGVLHMTFEVSAARMVRKWVQMLGGLPVSEMARSDYVAARRRLARMPLMLPAVHGTVELSELERVVRDVVAREGVEHVVVDHVGFVECSIDARALVRQSVVVRTLKKMCLELGVHMVLVSHFRKVQDGVRHGLDDVLGSGDVTRLADNVITVRRPTDIGKEKKLKNLTASVNHRTLVDLIKVRDDEGFEGRVYLGFDIRSLRYSPLVEGK